VVRSMWYRISWKSPVTGEVQRDRPLFTTLEVAKNVARLMNEAWPDTEHWAEPATSGIHDSTPYEGEVYAQPRA
jgi:hypothetical protein